MLGLTAATGSTGTTTAALTLAAVTQTDTPDGGLLVELDPAGGDLECWCGPHGEPGLLTATTSAGGLDSEGLRARSVEVVPGVRALVAPTGARACAAVLSAASHRLIDAVADLDGPVVVDRGRWDTASSAVLEPLAATAELTAVVCNPTLASVEHTRDLITTLTGRVRGLAVVVVGGERPYGPDEIAAALGVPVAGVLPWDPRAVRSLVDRGVTKTWLRSQLATAAREVAGRLQGLGWIADSKETVDV